MRRYGRARQQVNRYSPPNFHLAFALSATEEEYPITLKEAIDSTEGELWKKSMEEEMESL